MIIYWQSDSGILSSGDDAVVEIPENATVLTEKQYNDAVSASLEAVKRPEEADDVNQTEAIKIYTDLVEVGLSEDSAKALARLRYAQVVFP